MKDQSEKNISQKSISSKTLASSCKLKGKKNQSNRLEPLNAKVENNPVFNAVERKSSHRLNPLPNKSSVLFNQKKLISKIPVLQKKVISVKQNTDEIYCDTSLSAADRRQKFQQSHPRAGIFNIDPALKKQPSAQYCYDVFPWYEGFILHKVVPPPPSLPPPPRPLPSHVINQKNVLPSIKPVDVSVGSIQKISQTKTKCLLGEFTHFPALCNSLSFKGKKHANIVHYTSTVPHLPPIMSSPPAPPPSISSSLEKNGNQVGMKALNNKWIASGPLSQNVIPVSF